MTVQYQKLLKKIISHGVDKGDRTGTGTRSLFGPQMEFDLREGFPLLTTKKLPFRWIVEELLWMLSGSTDEADLRAKGVDIWKEWATEEQCARFGRKAGDLGPVYGHQFRNFGATSWENLGQTHYRSDGVDQIAAIVDQLTETVDSRRIILTGWNPKEATEVALPPCHTLTQFYVANGRLSCKMFQRSADVFLGVPFNIASYALLTHMLAHVCGLEVGTFIHTFGDVHIYNNHKEQVLTQLYRKPKPLPKLFMRRRGVPQSQSRLETLLSMTSHDFEIKDYDPHPRIKAPVAV